VANDPMKQFEIKKILELPQIAGQDISFTNSSLWMVIGVFAIIAFFAFTAKGKLIPGRLQSLGEMSYEFIADMVKDTTGPEAMKFFPFVFCLFFFLFAIFTAYLVGKGGLMAGAAIVPIIGTMGIVALEFLVAGLQAFVFAILTCVYLNDVYHVDH